MNTVAAFVHVIAATSMEFLPLSSGMLRKLSTEYQNLFSIMGADCRLPEVIVQLQVDSYLALFCGRPSGPALDKTDSWFPS